MDCKTHVWFLYRCIEKLLQNLKTGRPEGRSCYQANNIKMFIIRIDKQYYTGYNIVNKKEIPKKKRLCKGNGAKQKGGR